jgi:multiple sugar transport system ATP-binding protein
MIELRNVTKRYGLTTLAVRNVSFEIRDHEFLAIYGPAGAGKTTTLRMIAGIAQLSAGDILQDGVSIAKEAPENRNMAMAFENYALYSHLTVKKNLSFPLEAKKFPQSEIETRIQKISYMLQIAELLERRPGFLSGGQRQRVALGRALIRPASVYLLDEPIGHLDAKLRNRLRGELKAMAVDQNSTVVMVPTASREALAMGDRVGILNNGKLEQIGTPEEIYQNPKNEFVASFVGEPPMSFIDVEPETIDGNLKFHIQGCEHSLQFPEALSKSTGNGSKTGYRVGVRASEVTIASQKDEIHQISAEVYVVETLGYCNHITVRLGDCYIRVVVKPLVRPKVGETIWLSLDSNNMHVFYQEKAISHPMRNQKVNH